MECGMILSQVHSHPLNHWHHRHDLQLAWTRWVIRECKLLDTSDLLHTSSTPHPSYRWAKMSTWCWFRLLAVWQCLQLDLSSSFSIISFMSEIDCLHAILACDTHIFSCRLVLRTRWKQFLRENRKSEPQHPIYLQAFGIGLKKI